MPKKKVDFIDIFLVYHRPMDIYCPLISVKAERKPFSLMFRNGTNIFPILLNRHDLNKKLMYPNVLDQIFA